MTNNDILRRIRYTFNFNDDKMMEVFTLGGLPATRSQISDWLKKDDDPAFSILPDQSFAQFLNGWIVSTRGKKEGEQPVPESRLNNNIIFRKLKIALNLQAEDILGIMMLANFRMSKHELSAFFRNPSQSQYRPCQNQILRNFLQGMQMKYRDGRGKDVRL